MKIIVEIPKTEDSRKKSWRKLRRKAMKWKINGYHRTMVARYYKNLIDRFGWDRVMGKMPQLAAIVWMEDGLELVENHLEGPDPHE